MELLDHCQILIGAAFIRETASHVTNEVTNYPERHSHKTSRASKEQSMHNHLDRKCHCHRKQSRQTTGRDLQREADAVRPERRNPSMVRTAAHLPVKAFLPQKVAAAGGAETEGGRRRVREREGGAG
eukprot:5466036-Pleurochrysis_carterae.AAC.1